MMRLSPAIRKPMRLGPQPTSAMLGRASISDTMAIPELLVRVITVVALVAAVVLAVLYVTQRSLI
jgi:hypothetical protein